MSGELESLRDKLLQMERETDDFLEKKKLLILEVEIPIEHYLSITYDDLHPLPPDELGEMAFEFFRYAHYVQTELNRFQVRVNICKNAIKRLVGHKLSSYSDRFLGQEEKWIAAIHDNVEAGRWQKLEQHYQLLVDRLSYTVPSLNRMGEAALELQKTKRGLMYGKV